MSPEPPPTEPRRPRRSRGEPRQSNAPRNPAEATPNPVEGAPNRANRNNAPAQQPPVETVPGLETKEKIEAGNEKLNEVIARLQKIGREKFPTEPPMEAVTLRPWATPPESHEGHRNPTESAENATGRQEHPERARREDHGHGGNPQHAERNKAHKHKHEGHGHGVSRKDVAAAGVSFGLTGLAEWGITTLIENSPVGPLIPASLHAVGIPVTGLTMWAGAISALVLVGSLLYAGWKYKDILWGELSKAAGGKGGGGGSNSKPKKAADAHH
jgi:hypothetical protein